MKDHEIHSAMRLLRRQLSEWKVPAVGVVAEAYETAFCILISCILSLRTKDETTGAASERLFALATDPASMLRLPQSAIEQAIYPVGFYRTKAKNIHAVCRRLLEVYGGKVPDSIEELLTFEGVGRKTANLVVTIGYGKPGICVDVHVHRISNRWGYVRTKTPEQTEQALREKLPRRYWIRFNDLLVPFGQNVCLPVSPYCSRCQVKPFCDRVGVTRSR